MTAPTLDTTDRPLSEYHLLSPDELREELSRVSARLAGYFTELTPIRKQWLYYFFEGYNNSHETSVSGRERSGEYAARSLKEDELDIEGNISSATVQRDLLVTLLERRG